MIDVDREIVRRRRNRRGRTPASFPEPLERYGMSAPWGAIVDGYQLIGDRWHRIDAPGDIDLEALRQCGPAFAAATLEQAVQLWRDSIGEMAR
jgi:hypothetical protein